MKRLGDLKPHSNFRLKTPVYTSGNWYYLKKQCSCCGLPLRGAIAQHATACRNGSKSGRKERSDCQKWTEAQSQKKARDRDKARGIKRRHTDHTKSVIRPQGKEEMRECLRCYDTKTDKPTLFLSKSKWNRICPKCTNSMYETFDFSQGLKDATQHVKGNNSAWTD